MYKQPALIYLEIFYERIPQKAVHEVTLHSRTSTREPQRHELHEKRWTVGEGSGFHWKGSGENATLLQELDV